MKKSSQNYAKKFLEKDRPIQIPLDDENQWFRKGSQIMKEEAKPIHISIAKDEIFWIPPSIPIAFYRKEIYQSIKTQNPILNEIQISSLIAKKWRSEPKSIRLKYYLLAFPPPKKEIVPSPEQTNHPPEQTNHPPEIIIPPQRFSLGRNNIRRTPTSFGNRPFHQISQPQPIQAIPPQSVRVTIKLDEPTIINPPTNRMHTKKDISKINTPFEYFKEIFGNIIIQNNPYQDSKQHDAMIKEMFIKSPSWLIATILHRSQINSGLNKNMNKPSDDYSDSYYSSDESDV